MAGRNNVAILKPGFGVFLKAYNVYNLISKQLTSRSFLIITAEELQANLNAILSGKRRWLAVIPQVWHRPTRL
jgi:hypothetical protein